MRTRKIQKRETEAERIARFARIAAEQAAGGETRDQTPVKAKGSIRRTLRVVDRRRPKPAAIINHEVSLVYHPRAHQDVATTAILAARAAGRDAFLLGDQTGVGKTLPAWLAAAAMDGMTVLIVSTPGGMPQWRRTILGSGVPKKRKVFKVVTHDSLGQLLEEPKPGMRSIPGARRGHLGHAKFRRRWDIVVIDECHRMRNQNTLRALVGKRLIEQADFTIFVSATAGEVPRHLHYMAPLLERSAGLKPKGRSIGQILHDVGVPTYAESLAHHDSSRAAEAAIFAAERQAVARILFSGKTPAGIRRRTGDIDGWPAIQRELAPIALDEQARADYENAWHGYAEALESLRLDDGAVTGVRKKRSRFERSGCDMIFRKKASLLRAPGTVDFIDDLVDGGQQVAVSVFFLETARTIQQACLARRISCEIMTGGASKRANEEARVAFQTGRASVIVSTVSESISLHQGEMPGGEKVRATIIHDMKMNAIDTRQVEGRTNRDGVASTIYYTYAEDTVEEEMCSRIVARMQAMDGMAGDDTTLVDELAAAIDERMRRESRCIRRAE